MTKKTRIIIAVAVTALVLTCVGVVVGLYIFFVADNYSPMRYESHEEVIDTFFDNREDFEEMVSILDGSDLWQYLSDSGRSSYVLSTRIPHWRDYLTGDEYSKVKSFMVTYGPDSMRDTYESFYIGFLCKNESVILHYTELEGDRLERYLSYIGGITDDCQLIQLDEHWYIRFWEYIPDN